MHMPMEKILMLGTIMADGNKCSIVHVAVQEFAKLRWLVLFPLGFFHL